MGVLSTHGRSLDPGPVGVGPGECPPLPDAVLADPSAGRLDPRLWFADPSAPLELEIGPGKGTFLVSRARGFPAVNVLGIESAGEFFAFAGDRARRAGLGNVRVLHADAADFLHWRCPDGIVRAIHLYFPDPWPKARHHKRRIVSDRFLADAWRVLEPGGELRVVTDHDGYWGWMSERFERACAHAERPFVRVPFEPAPTSGEGELVGTNFERKYRRQGRPFHALVLRTPAP